MSCPRFEAIDEYLAVGVPPELLPGQHRDHLEVCASCQVSLEESLELARLLEEPLLLPPADLTRRILAAVATPPKVKRVANQERFLWAALGAAAASLVPVLFQWNPAPLVEAAAALIPAWEWGVPAVDPLWGGLGAVALLAAQASLLWGARRAAC